MKPWLLSCSAVKPSQVLFSTCTAFIVKNPTHVLASVTDICHNGPMSKAADRAKKPEALSVAKLLLAAKAQPDGWCLYAAARARSAEMVSFLLEAKASPKVDPVCTTQTLLRVYVC